MKKGILFLILLSGLFMAYRSDHTEGFRIPEGFPPPVYSFASNLLTEEKIQLGRALFYDNLLSRNQTISCASCHSNYNAFAHTDHALSHGIDDSIGTRNAPALINLAWQNSFMWDGAINHLDMQALAPMHNRLEMDESIEHVVQKLQATPVYRKLYYEAFGDSTVTGEHTLKAMSAFMLTLVSAGSKYDSVKLHRSVFTLQESKGYNLFKTHCAGCHTEPMFTNYSFQNNGLPVDEYLHDAGRMRISKNPGDSMKFKVPTLRNVEYTFPYMHDGRFRQLSEVINHYNQGIRSSSTLSPLLKKPMQLTSEQKVDLIAFLLTLSDKHFIFNAKHAYPRNIFFPQAKESK
ncbi:MAG: c-type cytochrome [Chitinophagaceae bacterium]|nr:c-type cytochrome [Chitinophagaceae bacterium]